MKNNQMKDSDKKMVDEWLKKNKVTVCPPGERSEKGDVSYTHGWGKKKAKQPTKSD